MLSHSFSSDNAPLSHDQRDLLDAVHTIEAALTQFEEFLPAELTLPRRPNHYQQALESGYAALGQAQTLLDTYRSRLAFERDRFTEAQKQFAPPAPHSCSHDN